MLDPFISAELPPCDIAGQPMALARPPRRTSSVADVRVGEASPSPEPDGVGRKAGSRRYRRPDDAGLAHVEAFPDDGCADDKGVLASVLASAVQGPQVRGAGPPSTPAERSGRACARESIGSSPHQAGRHDRSP